MCVGTAYDFTATKAPEDTSMVSSVDRISNNSYPCYQSRCLRYKLGPLSDGSVMTSGIQTYSNGIQMLANK